MPLICVSKQQLEERTTIGHASEAKAVGVAPAAGLGLPLALLSLAATTI